MTVSRISGSARSRFLQPGASTQDLIRSAVRNHRRWFEATAKFGGGEVRTDLGCMRMVSKREIIIPFPSLARAGADAVLDMLVAEARTIKPNIVGVWATTPTRPRDLGARLLARGFSVGWKPHWMAMDFRKLPDVRLPTGVRIAVEPRSDWDADELPYYSRESQRDFDAMAAALPNTAFHLVAREGDRVVGHSVMFMTRGALGVAGIYNVGVLQAFQRRGIGSALMHCSCELAATLGCHYALLNSAASEFYSSIGFDSLGWGQTWWMHRHTMDAPEAKPRLVHFITALAHGDVRALRSIDAPDLPPDLDARLPNGMTPVEIALTADKPGPAVQWLVDNGAILDLRSAWDAGWRDRIQALAAARPELIDRRTGDWKITPLHEAVYRNDSEFVRVLLSCGPDLEIKDTQFHSTPLGWARHFHRTDIIAEIEAHMHTQGAG